jgi:hypothetical protein
LGWYRKQNKMKWIRWGIDVRCGVYLVVRSWGHKSTRTMHEHGTWDKLESQDCTAAASCCLHFNGSLLVASDWCWENILWRWDMCLIDGWSSMVLCYHWVWTFQFVNADSSLNLFQAPKG